MSRLALTACLVKLSLMRSLVGERILKWLDESTTRLKQANPRIVSSSMLLIAAVVTGLVAVAYAKLVDFATAVMSSYSENYPFFFIFTSPLCFILAWALVRYFSPKAGGSGIPQVLASVENLSHDVQEPSPGIAGNLRLIIVKVFSSVAAILGGGIIGREGPTIQISAAVFLLFDGAFKRFSRRKTREALLIAGGGAGLAAAFNTPLGGVVFAIEELAQNHFKQFKGVLIFSVVIAGYVTQAILGPYLFVGHPTIGSVSEIDFSLGMLAAVVTGLVGAWFGRILFMLMQWAGQFSAQKRLVLAAGIGLAMSVACVLIGRDASGGGSLLIKDLLFDPNKEIPWILAVWRTVGLMMTYVAGVAGGIFAPSLAAGAVIGAKFATLVHAPNPNLIIVLAMISFLTGATRSPLTSFILVFEMTDRQSAIIPMMSAALLSNFVARAVEEDSFYEKSRDVLLGKEGLPFHNKKAEVV